MPEHAARHVRGLARPAAIEHLPGWASRRSSCCRCTRSASEPALADRGRPNYWGYSTLGFFAPQAALRRRDGPARRRRRVQGHGSRAARGRPRGDPRRRLQPHVRGRPRRPHPVLARPGQRAPTTGWTRTAATSTSPAAATASTSAHPRSSSWSLDSLRYWVEEMHVDGFRFDLAPALARGRTTASTPTIPSSSRCASTRCSSRVKLIAEPWDVGAARLAHRPVPAAVRRVERPLPRRRAGRSGSPTAGRRRAASRPRRARPRHPAGRLGRTCSAPRPRTAGVGQLRHRARRLHPRRPGGLRPQAQRGQRRGQPGRPRRQPVLEPRRRGPDGRRGRRGRAPPHDAQPARHAAALHRRADDHRRRRDRTHPGRQQQRLLPGRRDSWVDWDLAPLAGDLLATTAHLLGLRRRAPGAAPATVLRRAPGARDGTRTSPGSAPTAPRWTTSAGTTPSLRTLQMYLHAVVPDSRGGHLDESLLVVLQGGRRPVAPAARPAVGRAVPPVWDSARRAYPPGHEQGPPPTEQTGGPGAVAALDDPRLRGRRRRSTDR